MSRHLRVSTIFAELMMGIDLGIVTADVFRDVTRGWLYFQIGVAMIQGVLMVKLRRLRARDRRRNAGLW